MSNCTLESLDIKNGERWQIIDEKTGNLNRTKAVLVVLEEHCFAALGGIGTDCYNFEDGYVYDTQSLSIKPIKRSQVEFTDYASVHKLGDNLFMTMQMHRIGIKEFDIEAASFKIVEDWEFDHYDILKVVNVQVEEEKV